MPNQNAAGRLFDIAEKILPLSPNMSVVDGWAIIFGIEADEATRKSHEVAEALSTAYTQVDLLGAGLQERSIEVAAYAPTLERVRNSLSTVTLSNPWSTVIQYYPAETMASLRLMRSIIPDESFVAKDELAAIKKHIAQLRERIAAGTLPAPVREFLVRQLAILERALRDYQIVGVAAFTAAADSAAVEWLKNSSQVAEYKSDATVVEVGALWPKVQSFVKKATIIGAFGTALLGGMDKVIHIANDLKLPAPTSQSSSESAAE